MTNPSGRIYNFFLPSALVLMIFGACVKPTINFGTAFVNNNNTNIVVVDTFSTLMSTVYVDSFPTAQTGTILLGRYKDDAFGKITARTFYQLAPPVNLPTIDPKGGYDSLVLITRLNKYFYGDTAVPLQLNVSQLLTTIQYPGTQTVFFNNDVIPFNSTPLASTTLQVFPLGGYTSQLAGDSMKVTLPNSIGQDLFDMLVTKSPTVTNVNSFLGYFKGLTVYPDAGYSGAIYGFRDTVVMRLYYHQPGVVTAASYTDFVLWNRALQFNNIAADRTGTPTAKVVAVPQTTPGVPVELSSDSTDHAAYVQSTTSMQVKIRFPYIWKLKQLPDFVSILKADLIITPIAGTYSPLLALPPQLEIYQTDERNFLGVPVIYTGAQFGNLVVDYVYGINTHYTYDLTNYLRSQINAGADLNLKNGVMIVQPAGAYNTTFNRAIFGDRNAALNNRIQLKIYYASFY